jgi:hypothetical protein
METTGSYENYPLRLIAATVLVNVAIYAVGAFIVAGFDRVMVVLYLFYGLSNEIHVMKRSCVDCSYFGKWCAFGRGKAAALFFRRGDPRRFVTKAVTTKDLTMDMLVVIFPFVVGIALLIKDFSWLLVIALVLLLALSFGGNYPIRNRIACAFCRQRELGCPVERFFCKQNT